MVKLCQTTTWVRENPLEQRICCCCGQHLRVKRAFCLSASLLQRMKWSQGKIEPWSNGLVFLKALREALGECLHRSLRAAYAPTVWLTRRNSLRWCLHMLTHKRVLLTRGPLCIPLTKEWTTGFWTWLKQNDPKTKIGPCFPKPFSSVLC